MKTKWPACRLAGLFLVCVALIASAASAAPGPSPKTVRVDAHVNAQTVRIETKASGPFEFTSYRPSESLLIVDLAGVVSAEPSVARVLDSEVVSSYRTFQHAAGDKPIVRLEVLLRTPAQPRFERRRLDELAVVFDPKPSSPLAIRREVAPTKESLAVSATMISQVEITSSGDWASVRVQGNGHLKYQAARMSKPERVVLDFAGTQLAVARTSIPSDMKPVRGVRLGQFRPDVARVVIDLDRAIPYSVKGEGSIVTVGFDALVATPANSPGPPRASNELEKDPASGGAAERAEADLTPPASIQVSGMPLPESLTSRDTALARLATPADGSAPVVANPSAQQPGTQTPAQQPATKAPAQVAGKYSGEPISVNLKDVDLKDFFRLIHEISALNVVLDPSVKGTLTIVLDDVPWDQALDIVLRNNNLDKQLDGNVLRVATRDTLKKEAEIKRDLAKAEAEAIDPVTATRVLSYSKASTMRDTLKKFLSSRGEILADERSNTIIIRDIPSVLPEVDNLIRQLDRKAQQVEIESRVVAATRLFARDIGSQFAFAGLTTSGRSVFGGASAVGTSPISHPASLPPPLVVGSSTQMPLNTNLAAQTPTSGVTFAHSSPNFALDYIITAAESKGVGKLLSKPKVITQNNEKAEVKQGTKIPIQTTINNTISVQFIDAVLRLQVTPQITADGTIFMDVIVENTQIDAGIPRVQGIPALNTQSAETKVLINDGGTVVIGGVIISQQRTDISQVPLVGSIPLIGHLFKRTAVNIQSQELLFFLTPRILPN